MTVLCRLQLSYYHQRCSEADMAVTIPCHQVVVSGAEA